MSTHHHFISAIGVAKNIQQNLKLFLLAEESRKRLDNIISLAQEYATLPLIFHELVMSEEDSAIKGAFIRRQTSYDILILSGMNHCWTRFVTCKEVMHALLDCDEFHNHDMELGSHIEQTVDLLPHESLSACSELLAEAAAMEVMFPIADRELIIASGTVDYFAIADRYKIPELLVQRYLSQPYMNWFRQF